jgi:acyl carrier protein
MTTTVPAAGNNPTPGTQCAALVMTDELLLSEVILGTLKAGKIPVFISPHHPGEHERLKWIEILEDSEARVIITTVKDSKTAKQIRDSFNKRIPVITVDEPTKQKINKKLLQGVQGDGFLEKSPPGRRRQNDPDRDSIDIEATAADITNSFLKGETIDLKKNRNRNSGYFHSLSELREYLQGRIPEYMIPAYFVQMEKLPLTSGGKIDRMGLPEPEILAGETYTAPANEIEKKLAEMWGEILGLDKENISMEANFFELGGHSLKATILIARIHRVFDVKIPLAGVFEFPTIRGITAIILNTEKEAFIDLEKAEKKEYYPLSFHQERLWYIQQAEPETTAFTLIGRIPLDHEVKPGIIKKTLNTLMARHESFRTYYRTLAEIPVQLVADKVEVPLQIIDLLSMEESEKERECERIYDDEARTPGDITHAPVFRCLLVKMDKQRNVLIFSMNHISTDGWSMEIIRNEFSLLYEAYRAGKEINLGPLEWQYKDFSQWQHRQMSHPVMREKSHQFWKEKLETGVSPLVIPGDFKSGRADRTGAYWQFMIDNHLKEKLKQLADATGTTLFMVMFSTYILLLSRFSHQEDIACAIIHSGRSHTAMHRIMGFFVNSILFKTRVDVEENFSDMLERVSKDTLEVFQHQNYPIELVCDELKMKYPDISVCFNMLHVMEQARRETLEPYEPYLIDDERDDAKFDIETYFIEFQNGINVRWMYKKNVYKPETMRYIIDEYIKILDYFAENPGKSYRDYRHEDNQESIW